MTGSPDTPEANARAAIDELLDGQAPNGIASDSCGRWADLIQAMYDAHAGGGTADARRLFDLMAKKDPAIARLRAGAVKRYEVFGIGDAMREQPPIRWIVHGLFQEGSLNVVFGEPGSKKTWACLDCGVSTAMGETWLDKVTDQVPVLIVDEESGRRRLERRIAAIAKARHAPHSTPFAYVSLTRFDFQKVEDAHALRQLIEETDAGLVIIDAMADVMPGAEENSVKEVQPILLRLRKVAEETRAAIVLIHHANRAGDYRGSSAIAGALDVMLKIESQPGSDFIDITSVKVRDAEPFNLRAHIRFEDAPFKVFINPADPKERPETLTAGEEYVLGFLRQHGASAISDITKQADTCATETARKGVYSLTKKGLAHRVDNGGQGTEATYDLCEVVLESS